MHPLLAGFMQDWKNETPYGQPTDWLFASFRLKGKQPRNAIMGGGLCQTSRGQSRYSLG